MTGVLPAQLAAASAAVALVAGVRAVAVARRPRIDGPRRNLLADRAFALRLGSLLQRAGVTLSAEAFLIGAVGGTAAAALGVVAITGTPLFGVLIVGGAAVCVRSFLASVDQRYIRRIAAQLPGVAQQLSSAVAAGLSLRQAIGRAAADAPEPVAGELQRTAGDLALGARVDEALDGLVGRLPDPDLGIMVTAILVQRRTGGNMARALSDLSTRLEERVILARELRGATAQARATAMMVAALPAAAGVLVEFAAPGVVGRTFGSGIGLILLIVSVALEVTGFMMIRRIARVET